MVGDSTESPSSLVFCFFFLSFFWNSSSFLPIRDLKARRTRWGKSWANCLARRFAQPFSHRVRGTFGEKLASRGREEKIKHVWYFSPREANSSLCAAIVRIELSLVNEACNKNTWHSHVTSVTSEFLPPTPSWTAGVTWVCHVFLLDAWLNQAQLDSHDGRTHWGICLARPKKSNMFDFVLTGSWGEFLTTISPHTWGNGWANRLVRQFAQLFPQVCGGLKQGRRRRLRERHKTICCN